MQQLEEMAVQVLAPPVVGLHVADVAAVHRVQQLFRERVAAQHLDRHPPGLHLAPLAPDLVAALAPEAAQVVLEAGVAVVVPVVLEAHAQLEVRVGEALGLLRAAEVHVDARKPPLDAELAQRVGQPTGPEGAVQPLGHQEARPGDRREGHAHQQLRVAGLLQRGEPVPLEEGRLLAHQRVPLLAGDGRDAFEHLELGHRAPV